MVALAAQAPDVLLVDLGLPDMSGLDIIRLVAARHKQCDILVISMFGDEAVSYTHLDVYKRQA